MATCVPYIDPNVEHVGVSRLRSLNATNLRHFDKTLVIQDNDTPLAVLLTYEQFLEMQKQLLAVAETVSLMTDEEELASLTEGIEDAREGRTRPLSEIRAELNSKRHKKAVEE
jgi:hypothetical protein